MDQPLQYSGLTATVQNLLDKQSACNDSIGVLSGIPRPGWGVYLTRKVPDNQPLNKVAKGVNNPSENNSPTVSEHIIRFPATEPTRTPSQLAPTAAGTLASTSHTNANPQSAPARCRSISEVQADIKIRIADIDVAQSSLTEAGIPAMPESLAKMQAVTPQNSNVPTGPRKGITSAGNQRPKKKKPTPRTKQEMAEADAEKHSEWAKSFHLGDFPNPRFVDLGDGAQRNMTRVFPIQICKAEQDATFGRRLVIFTDSSYELVTGISGSAVVYRRFYDLELTEAESSGPGAWENEAYGYFGGPVNSGFEEIALGAALDIVHREVEDLFAKPHCEADGKRKPLRVYVFLDSRDAIRNLQKISTNQVKLKHLHDAHILRLTKAWRSVQPFLKEGKVRLEIHWLKGHNGVEGNIRADKLAQQARMTATRFAMTCSSSLGSGLGCEIVSLKDMEHELLLAKSTAKRGGSSSREDALGEIQKLFTDFFSETQENSEKLIKLAFEELRKELPKLVKESPQKEGKKFQKNNLAASDELRTEMSRLSRQQEAQNAQAESMMMALEEATGEWREIIAAQSREIKAMRKEGEKLLRTLRDETREAVKAVVQAVARGVEQTDDKSDGEGRSDDTSSTSSSRSDNQGEVLVGGKNVIADAAQPDDKVTSCASSDGSGETVKTAFRVAVNSVENEDTEIQGQVVVEEEDQQAVTSSTSTEAAQVTDQVTESRRQDDTIHSCASSSATVVGEIEALSAGADIREDNGGKSPGKLRRREKLLRKLHLRWRGRKSKAIDASRS